jgi:hypothetical protein
MRIAGLLEPFTAHGMPKTVAAARERRTDTGHAGVSAFRTF